MEKQSIALVLSSGGARGIAHIGVIEELEEQGFKITSVAGSSMGSVIAGVYAMGSMQIYKDWLLTLKRTDVLNLTDFTFSKSGLIKGEKVFKTMQKFIPDKNIEDLKIPFTAVATDILNEREVVFSEGSIYDAMRASTAIPTVFKPVKSNNTILVDGGVLNPLPLNQIKRNPGDLLVAVDVYADIPIEHMKNKTDIVKNKFLNKHLNISTLLKLIDSHKKDQRKIGYLKLIDYATRTMVFKLSEMALELYKPDIIINISRHSGKTFDFYKSEELIEIGRKAARKSIENFKSNL
ncbi:MAG: patatin-like phospholipase family protein [Bacteroidales bacterium]|nr:patatin-like phospholipase family protein [Bacteroidales bacterium]